MLDTSTKMHAKGFSISEIVEITGLSEIELRRNGII
jgi:hypothetical protein